MIRINDPKGWGYCRKCKCPAFMGDWDGEMRIWCNTECEHDGTIYFYHKLYFSWKKHGGKINAEHES